MWPDRIPYALETGTELPSMFLAEQVFPRPRLDDVFAEALESMERLPLPDLKGKRLAVTAGSRGISDIVPSLRAVIAFLKSRDAEPFLIPAMGSHGGANAEGQVNLLKGLGITEESMGVPIRSSMETVSLGVTEGGYTVHCDRFAFDSDGIVVCNRVKAHTDFKMDIESGLCKMMSVGLGKHKGAAAVHGLGVANLGPSVLSGAKIFLEKAPVLFGLALVENAFEETMIAEALMPGQIISREKELLVIAKESMGRLYPGEMDILIAEKIGKEISGAGMDPNISGRPMPGALGFEKIWRPTSAVVLGVTDHSAGNALGIGLADITTVKAVKNLDLASTYTNGITAGDILGCSIPLMANTERDAVAIAISACAPKKGRECRIIQVKNTLELTVIALSEAYWEEVQGHPSIRCLTSPEPMKFSSEGDLERVGNWAARVQGKSE
ncbi:MAG: hypothetical protein ACOX5A_05425 [Aminivibrio sp.]